MRAMLDPNFDSLTTALSYSLISKFAHCGQNGTEEHNSFPYHPLHLGQTSKISSSFPLILLSTIKYQSKQAPVMQL